MRVFVTGATGFIGEAVIKELLSSGHTVLGLVRSEKGAAKLKEQGVEVVQGTIEDLDILKNAAGQCDAVIHLAFIVDFSDFEACCAKDRAAITAMGDALVATGSERSFVTTTGTMLLQHGQLAFEKDPPSHPFLSARGAAETLCLDYAKHGIRTSVVRLPPSTHGPGQSGFLGFVIDVAIQKGFSAYVGEGQNRWSASHRDDAAKLYRLAIEKAEPGSTFHGVDEEGVPLKDVATEIGKQLGVPVKSLTEEEAQEHFGWLAFSVLADNPASSKRTREMTGWKPSGASLVEDVKVVIQTKQAS